jgi:hypothetical protein
MAFFGGGEVLRPGQDEADAAPGESVEQAGTQGTGNLGQVRGGSGYNCAHCPQPPKEALAGKRCKYCKNLLCETCPEGNCPYICGTCAHCGQHFTEHTKKGACDYCYNLICTECNRPCPNPRYTCYHCKRPIGRNQSNQTCDGCGYLIHSDCRSTCPEGYRGP